MTHIKFLQINLHHAKGSSGLLCRRFINEGLNIALIQEPWVNKNKIRGLNIPACKLFYCDGQDFPRAAIMVSKRTDCYPLTEFIKRDIAAVSLQVPTARGTSEVFIASAYFPGDTSEAPPPETAAFIKFCREKNKPFIIGCDANAHHTVWGSTDINSRGECLLDFLSTNNIDICNTGDTPTFVNSIRQEVLDLTLCSPIVSEKIKDWHVSDETSLSDHKHILFTWMGETLMQVEYRNPRRTNWDLYRQTLFQQYTFSNKIRSAQQLELASEKLSQSITSAYTHSCPTKAVTSNRDVPWWNKKLAKLRKMTRRLFNRAKITLNWSLYKQALSEYNREIRKSKRKTWINTCESIENTNVVARLQKALAKDHSNGLGQLKKHDGSFTSGPSETLDLMMRTHFPDSIPVSHMVASGEITSDFRPNCSSRTANGLKQVATKVAKTIFTDTRIEHAVSSFQPFKSSGVDGLLPAMVQQACPLIIPQLAEIFKASLILNHIPSSWNLVKVVFIPKVGKKDKNQPKAFRPISLTSIMLKIMEKILHEFINSAYIDKHPLSKIQFAYKTGKSTVTALHTLVSKIEKTLSAKEIALCAFLDIEGAFDNASFASMINAMNKRLFDHCIVNWIRTMLANREITSELSGSSVTVKATKGCPQGGVLSPLLWSLVVDDLLNSLEEKGFEVVGFADDVVIIVRGKYDSVVSDRIQIALNLALSWCNREKLGINPSKTVLIPFTNRRKYQVKLPRLGDVQINLSDQVKYLGVILDQKLTWNAHIDSIINKATSALWACSRTIGRKWGLKPSMILWVYNTIIRPKITYGSLVWWPKTTEKHTQGKLAKLQRMVTLSTTGAMRSTPTKALDAILYLNFLHEFVQLDALKSALRLKNFKVIKEGDIIGHLKILKIFTPESATNMIGDWTGPMDNFEIPYKVHDPSRITWDSGGPIVRQGSIIFYTDGSKIGTNTGAGVFGPKTKISVAMGNWPTVFQAEIFAIIECSKLCLKRKYRHSNICIFSDSQAALKSLRSSKVSSKIVWECILSLRLLSQRNSVNLYWIPGHSGHDGNEKADELARLGSNTLFIGPEPFIGISSCILKLELQKWEQNQVVVNWQTTTALQQSKRFITPNKKTTQKLLELSKKVLCTYTGLMTGHCPSRYHMKTIGKLQNDTCRFCNTERETSEHLLCDCPALCKRRARFLGRECLSPREIWTASPVRVVDFIFHIIPDWDSKALYDTPLVTQQ